MQNCSHCISFAALGCPSCSYSAECGDRIANIRHRALAHQWSVSRDEAGLLVCILQVLYWGRRGGLHSPTQSHVTFFDTFFKSLFQLPCEPLFFKI